MLHLFLCQAKRLFHWNYGVCAWGFHGCLNRISKIVSELKTAIAKTKKKSKCTHILQRILHSTFILINQRSKKNFFSLWYKFPFRFRKIAAGDECNLVFFSLFCFLIVRKSTWGLKTFQSAFSEFLSITFLENKEKKVSMLRPCWACPCGHYRRQFVFLINNWSPILAY